MLTEFGLELGTTTTISCGFAELGGNRKIFFFLFCFLSFAVCFVIIKANRNDFISLQLQLALDYSAVDAQ